MYKMDSIDKLLNYYNHGKKDDMYHSVVRHIMRNIDKIGKVSIYEIADLCYSSTSTISRVVKKLGFDNYQDFKAQLTYSLKNFKYLNRNSRNVQVIEKSDIIDLYFNFLTNNIHALRKTIDYHTIETISDCFYHNNEFIFYTCTEVCLDILQKSLIVTGKTVEIFSNLDEQKESIKDIKPGTVILAITPDLIEVSEMRTILKNAKKMNAYIITICSSSNNEFEQYSDLQIKFDGTKTAMDLYLFMIILNLIKYDYNNRYAVPTIENLYL